MFPGVFGIVLLQMNLCAFDVCRYIRFIEKRHAPVNLDRFGELALRPRHFRQADICKKEVTFVLPGGSLAGRESSGPGEGFSTDSLAVKCRISPWLVPVLAACLTSLCARSNWPPHWITGVTVRDRAENVLRRLSDAAGLPEINELWGYFEPVTDTAG
jgi:hypothetical protein